MGAVLLIHVYVVWACVRMWVWAGVGARAPRFLARTRLTCLMFRFGLCGLHMFLCFAEKEGSGRVEGAVRKHMRARVHM
jgi:hypothetical protein